jgi:predicted house-cleaning noncanonical NTP pyrophosphatase (MazG superfamily)
MPTIPKRVSTALINSLSAGVVPRIGLEHIAVGREKEMTALSQDLDNIAEGGAAFRFILGRYGAGKSFMLQLLRNQALEQGFVVADVDLSPERRLAGTNNQSVATYRELMPKLSTRTRPDGGALVAILEGWINDIQNQVAQDTGMRPKDQGFDDKVEDKIREIIKDIEGLVHGFDFANVIISYWRGYRLDDDAKKEAALRWLRGEFSTKTEAKLALEERVSIIDDESWYDYIKLLAKFVSDIGYKGLLVLIDEVVHLYKISHTLSRQKNYDKILAMFNDTRAGGAEHLGIFMGGTPQFLEDKRRGLYSDEALRTRLTKSRFVENGLQDTSEPVIRLETLTPEDILQILQRLTNIHAVHYNYKNTLKKAELQEFIKEVVNRLGTEDFLTPREVVRDFITILNLRHQNPSISFNQLIRGSNLQSTSSGKNSEADEDNKFAEFTL